MREFRTTITLSLPTRLVARMEPLVGRRERSAFVAAAIAEKLEREAPRPATQDEVERDAVLA